MKEIFFLFVCFFVLFFLLHHSLKVRATKKKNEKGRKINPYSSSSRSTVGCFITPKPSGVKLSYNGCPSRGTEYDDISCNDQKKITSQLVYIHSGSSLQNLVTGGSG